MLVVEMQGLDIFDALSSAFREGQQGGEREDGASSRGDRDSFMSSSSSTADSFER